MALDLSVGALVRAGSGALLCAVGLAFWTAGRRRLAELALGAWLVAFGARFVFVNLVGSPSEGPVEQTLGLLGVALAIYLAASWPEPPPRAARGAAVFAGLLTGALLLAYLAWQSARVGRDASFDAHMIVLLGWVLLLALRFPHEPDTRARRRIAILASALAVHPLFAVGQGLGGHAEGSGDLGLWPRYVLSAALVVAWLVATRGPDSRIARRAALFPMLVALAGMLEWTLLPEADGTPGLARTLAVILLVVGILRHGLLGRDLALPTARRGTVAAVALISFFVLAQVAQEFLSDTMGVVLGGVAAGALLFAAVPLQRAAERLAQPHREVAVTAPLDVSRLGESERAYRVTLRRFLADGRITPDEEIALAHLADQAGLTIRRVTEIRHEVEHELAQTRGSAAEL